MAFEGEGFARAWPRFAPSIREWPGYAAFEADCRAVYDVQKAQHAAFWLPAAATPSFDAACRTSPKALRSKNSWPPGSVSSTSHFARAGAHSPLARTACTSAFREHAAKQKQTLKGAFAADHAITADDRVDLEPDRLPIDEDPSDGA